MQKSKIMICIDLNLLQKIDEYILKNKYANEHNPANRSAFFEDAIIHYLKVKLGFSYFKAGVKI